MNWPRAAGAVSVSLHGMHPVVEGPCQAKITRCAMRNLSGIQLRDRGPIATSILGTAWNWYHVYDCHLQLHFIAGLRITNLAFFPEFLRGQRRTPTPPAAMLLWNAVKKHMTASVHLTLRQHCRWGAALGSGAYSTDLLKRQAQYFKA